MKPNLENGTQCKRFLREWILQTPNNSMWQAVMAGPISMALQHGIWKKQKKAQALRTYSLAYPLMTLRELTWKSVPGLSPGRLH